MSVAGWDFESFCVEGCGRPATHDRLVTFVDEDEVVELICCDHAKEQQ